MQILEVDSLYHLRFAGLFLCSASSNILSGSDDKRREVAGCLPELGCDGRESRVPVVGGSSPMGFLLSLTRLVYVLCKIHKGVVDQVRQRLRIGLLWSGGVCVYARVCICCLLYTSPSPRDISLSRMPSSA